MKTWLFWFVFWTVLSGCTTKKKVLKYLDKNPEVGAEYSLNKFPVKEVITQGKTDTIAGDTIFVKGDTVKCKDGTTVYIPAKPVLCPPSFYRLDTRTIIDSAKVFSLQSQNKAIRDSLSKFRTMYLNSQDRLNEARKTSDKRLFIIIALAILLGGSAYLNARGFIKKLF